MKVTQSPDLETENVDGELIVLNTAAGQVHKLNTTAAVIFELCDGSRTAEQIAVSIAEAVNQPVAPVLEDVQRTLQTFLELGIVVGETAPGDD